MLIWVAIAFAVLWIDDSRHCESGGFKTGDTLGEVENVSSLAYEPIDFEEVERLEAGEEVHAVGIVGALPSRAAWANDFRKARAALLRTNPLCEACGVSAEEVGPLNAHHVISVKRIVEEKLDPKLQWDVDNLIILCRGGRDCHHQYGHPEGWAKSNPNVRADAAKAFKKEWPGWTYEQLVSDYRSKQPTTAGEERKRAAASPSKTIQAP